MNCSTLISKVIGNNKTLKKTGGKKAEEKSQHSAHLDSWGIHLVMQYPSIEMPATKLRP